jgi:hypothetical protein
VAFVAIVAMLHVLKPEYEPSWRFLSEYAIGRHGWMMRLAFSCWALSCLCLAYALWHEVGGKAGKTGLVLLAIVGMSMIAAGAFTMDPITATQDQVTLAGHLHALSSMVGVPGLPVAALLVTGALVRNPQWVSSRAWLWAAACASLLMLVVLYCYVALVLINTGRFGPESIAGWINRLLVAVYLSWQWLAARGD